MIPDSVTSIGSSGFKNCSGLTGDLLIPEGITQISMTAFYGCSGLTGKITVPQSVTDIGTWAFYNCSAIRQMQFNGTAVPTISSDSFDSMNALETVWVPAEALEAYTAALEGRLPEGAVIRAIGTEEEPEAPSEPPADQPGSLDWFFDRLKESGSYLWATAAYQRITESLQN